MVTVTFKTNDEVINTQTFEKGGSAYAPYPGTYEKRDFLYYDRSLKNITENTVINSVWSDNKITISFDTDGGSSINEIVGFAGTAIGEIPVPTKEGYVFDGWDKSFNNIKADTVVTARWKDADELFDSTQVLSNTFLNSTANGTVNGYYTSNYFPCDYNHKLRIDVTRKGSALGDFRIALGTSNNNSYLATWQVGTSSIYPTALNNDGYY